MMKLEYVDSIPEPSKAPVEHTEPLRCMICNKPLHGNLKLTCGKPHCATELLELTRGPLDSVQRVLERAEPAAFNVKHLQGKSWVSDGTTGSLEAAEKAVVKLSERSPETRYRIYRAEDGKFVEFREGKPYAGS